MTARVLARRLLGGALLAATIPLTTLAEQREALAQPGGQSPPSPADVAKAKALFEAGGRAYDRAQYDVALQAFQQAYDIVPKDGLLFSIAQTHRRLFTTTGGAPHKERAVAAYRRYVERAKTGARVSDAVRALEELGATSSTSSPEGPPEPAPVVETKTRLYVSSATPGVRISVDDGALSEPNATVTAEVTPGKHKVRFTAPGFLDKELEATAVDHELVPVSFDLEPKPGVLALQTTEGADVSIDGRYIGEAPLSTLDLAAGRHFVVAALSGYETRSGYVTLERGKKTPFDLELDRTAQRDASFVVFAAAGASLVASGVLLGLTFAEQANAQAVRDAATTRNISDAEIDEYEAAKSARDTFGIAAGATGATAGVLAVVGLGMFFLDAPAKAELPAEPGPTSPTSPAPGSIDLESVSLDAGPRGFSAGVGFRF